MDRNDRNVQKTDRSPTKQMGGQRDRKIDRQIDIQIDGYIDRQIDRGVAQ